MISAASGPLGQMPNITIWWKDPLFGWAEGFTTPCSPSSEGQQALAVSLTSSFRPRGGSSPPPYIAATIPAQQVQAEEKKFLSHPGDCPILVAPATESQLSFSSG